MTQDTQKKIKLGIIGFGRLGEIHAKSIFASKDAELYAVCDINAEARIRAEALYDVPTYAALNDFLSLPIDGVVIASSTGEHLANIVAAAKAGLAIFTEKPIGLKLEETDIALQQVVDAGVAFQIGFQRRWDPRYLEARRIIKSGEVGAPILIKAYGRDPNASNPANWGLDKNGGLFLNAAIHDYDAARFFFEAEATSLSASGAALVYSDLVKANDIDTCTTTLFFEGNKMAMTEWSRYAAYGYDAGIEIVCAEGIVRIGPVQNDPLVVKHKNSKAPTVFDVFANAYSAEVEGFIASLKHGLPINPGIEDARIALQLALLAHKSFKADSGLTAIPRLDPMEKLP